MAFITPDLSPFTGPAGPSAPQGDTLTPEMLAALLQQAQQIQAPPQPQLPPELMQALQQRQNVGGQQGWSGPTIMPGPQQQPQFDPASLRTIANTSGYAGPLRPSDVPMAQAQPIMAPEKAQAEDEMQRLRGQNIAGVGNAGQMLDLAQVVQHLPKEVQAMILQRHMPQQAVGTGEGEGVLQGVEPGIAALVKKVANYEVPIAGFGGMDAKTRAKVLPLVAQYDPTFDATQYNARMKLRQDFTSGKSAQAIRSLNTVIQHMDSLDKAAAGLDNSQWQLWNYAANKGREASGDPRVDKFNTAATAVEDELSAVFKATGSTDTSIKQWKDRLSASKSPEQYKGIIQEAVNLLDGRMQAIQGTWNQGMGGKELPKPLLTPKAQATLDRLRTGESTVAPTNQPTTQVAAPASSEGKPTGRTSGGKPVFVRPNGTFFVQD